MEPTDWAAADRAGVVLPGKKPPSTPTTARSHTPVNPTLEVLRADFESRPQTPTVVGQDEREEFLKRENELSDQLAEKDSALNNAEKLLKDVREEFGFLKEQESLQSKVTDSWHEKLRF